MPSSPSQRQTAELAPHERAYYGDEARRFEPSSYEELAEIVREAEASQATILPAGRGSHAYLGNPPPRGAWVVSLCRLDKVLRYEPDDFTIGVHAGLGLAALRRELRQHGQEVPLDWPRTTQGTVGGLVSAAPPGARRARLGPVRAHIIGVVALRSGGRLYKAGGMVVKNVAGYEVMKLLAGALGTAGILLEVNFRLKPLPGRRAARLAAFAGRREAWAFARAVRESRVEPAALWVLEGPASRPVTAATQLPEGGPVVACIAEGNTGAVAWQEAQLESLLGAASPLAAVRIEGEPVDELLEALTALAEPGPEPRSDLGTARLASLPGALAEVAGVVHERLGTGVGLRLSSAADAQAGLLTLRWEAAGEAVAGPVAELRALAGADGRDGVLLYLPPGLRGQHRFALRPGLTGPLGRRLLGVFDPHGLFAPGRLLGSSSTS